MKKLIMFLAGLMLLVLTFGALYLGGAIYDAGEKRSIDTFFFQPNNLSADRPGELLTAAEMGESRILNMLVDRYVTEYFYVIPDRENIARRTRSDSVLARLSGADVFRTWQNTVANEIQTGYDLGIGSVVMTIAVSGGVAYVCTKKARARA